MNALLDPNEIRQVLRPQFRRSDKHYSLLQDHVDCMLSLIFELESYGQYLQSSPHCLAALLASPANPATSESILNRMKQEWDTVLSLESQKETRMSLHRLCPQVQWQIYRELHCALAAKQYKPDRDFLNLLAAWFPRVTGSSNIEQIFQSMERSLRQCGCTGGPSLPSLMSVGIRCTQRRLCENSRVETIHLQHEDYEGPEVRCLKDKIWRPSNAAPSDSTKPIS